MDNIRFISTPSELKFDHKNCITILGNGPSLRDIPKGYEFSGDLIGMNRIDNFLQDHDIKLFIYIFITDNIANREWGNEWYASLYNGFKASCKTIISKEVYGFLQKDTRKESKEILNSELYVINCLKEPRLYMRNSVVYPTKYFTKSGTSINFAAQVALLFDPKEINFYGVDLGWKTTSSKKEHDPNHYHQNYFARINSGYYENARMHYVHDRLSKIFDENKILVKNFSPRTIVDCYDIFNPKSKQLLRLKNSSKKNIFNRQVLVFIDETKNDIKRVIVQLIKIIKLKK